MLHVNRALLPVAAIICSVVSSGASASGCMREIVVPINFQQGWVCWRHVGVGTTFKGQFGAHQRVTASALGEFHESDDIRSLMTITGPWKLSVTGPNGFSAYTNEDGELDVVLPQSGQYSFVISPCSAWGNQGMIEI